MEAFNKMKYKGVKSKYKSFTHVVIGYENCEYLQIPLKYAKVIMSKDAKYIKELLIDFIKIRNKIDKWLYDSLEKRLERILYNSNDIASVKLIRINKNERHLWNFPTKELMIKDIYGRDYNNLLQSTNFNEELNILHYTWIVDENIKIDWKKEGYIIYGYIEIPSKYNDIISKLNKRIYEIKII